MYRMLPALLYILFGAIGFHEALAISSSLRGKDGQLPFETADAAPETRDARIYFLFLAVDKISNLNVWLNFFKTAPPDQYRAFVHCKVQSCIEQVKGTSIVAVPQVPSYYCSDLVSPMNQLVSYALSTDLGPTNSMDKFTFVSDSSLPAKPFAVMHANLMSRSSSDFCVFPPGEWADIPDAEGGIEVAVKVHQWITLSRTHAEEATARWNGGVSQDFMMKFHMNQVIWSNQLDNQPFDNRNWGCLDEFWYMTALFGTLKRVSPNGNQSIAIQGFTGSPLSINRHSGWQGECSTFVIWAKYMHSLGNNKHSQLLASMDPPSVPHGGNYARPGWWDAISRHGITGLRNSQFLFVRKFIDNPSLVGGGNFVDAYTELVFNQ
eukprot:TRINITY_DN115970_c0_g1_i1.p1 TRINITY_DN115970_c0_g1~~TRINITY_DN115970_c0_g1_i1.p1  ORF type:complete len:378 (-),score=45.26 TRINITY_DN115970_c0_g1_i1:73-1206(-)